MAKIEYIGGGQFAFRGKNIGPDYNFPSIAQDLGWSTRRVQIRKGKAVHLSRISDGCRHDETDGTIDCKACGIKAIQFITFAGEYLHEKAGE